MGFSNSSVLVILLLCFTILSSNITPSSAQNTRQDYLAAHNAARARVGVGAMHWNATLAAYAQNYANRIQRANTCNNLVHSGGPYGENLAAGTPGMTGQQAVNMWVGERVNYHYQSNSCDPGKVCGHYTQVVWRRSVSVGCARVRCANGWWYVICSYSPRGNIIGQRPY